MDPPRALAPAEAFSGLLVLIFGCFLMKAIWGFRKQPRARLQLLWISGKTFFGGILTAGIAAHPLGTDLPGARQWVTAKG